MNKIVIAIIEKDRAFLLVRRRQQEGTLHWQFPGGEVEEGESETAAVEREVFEETNVTCKALSKLGEREHPSNKRTVSYWLCNFGSGELIIKDSEELDQAEWVHPRGVFERITSDLYEPLKKYIQSKM
jgi:mutator protein MutT